MTAPPMLVSTKKARVWRMPGVYRPQEDSFLLAQALREAGGSVMLGCSISAPAQGFLLSPPPNSELGR